MTRIAALFLVAVASLCRADDAPPIKVGMIGLDTSHAIAFTQLFKQFRARPDVPACEVVAGFPHAVPGKPASEDRVKEYTEQLRTKWKVTIVASIDELLPLCDVVMIESVDGRPHLEEARPVFTAGKPLFIDKPLAASVRDAREIIRLSRESGVPFFSASALRFVPQFRAIKQDAALGAILGCDARSPCSLDKDHPDLYWYGIHGVDPLFMIMGRGCVEVSRIQTKDFELVAGRWADGRIGTFRGTRRGGHTYGITVFGERAVRYSPEDLGNVYEGLIIEIAKFFKTRAAPVDPEETLELLAFMSAADLSKERGGAAVKLAEALEK